MLNDPVVLLNAACATKKYSVRSQTEDDCAVVTVSASGIMAACNKGICQAAQRHKRSVKCLMEIEEASSLCRHLATMHANQDIWAPQDPPEAHEEFGVDGEQDANTGDNNTEDNSLQQVCVSLLPQ